MFGISIPQCVPAKPFGPGHVNAVRFAARVRVRIMLGVFLGILEPSNRVLSIYNVCVLGHNARGYDLLTAHHALRTWFGT